MTIFLFPSICTCLIILSIVDLKWLIVPYSLLLPLAVLCLAWNVHFDVPPLISFICAVAMALMALLLRHGIYIFKGQVGCGWGDVWLFFVCGMVISSDQLAPFFLVTGSSGIIFGSLWQTVKGQSRFPFVPCLSLGLATALWLQLPGMK
ncbi:MAG: prepilin peptidase [Pseudomonadota bacterium]